MIVTAKNITETQKLLGFLHAHGVILPWSTDLRFLARVNEAGTVLGVVAYNGFSGAVCCMHCAGDGNWITREFLKAAFDYPFNKCGIVAIFGMVSASNLLALRLDEHLGFEEVHTVSRGYDGNEDLVILKMTKENCRWIREKADEQQAS